MLYEESERLSVPEEAQVMTEIDRARKIVKDLYEELDDLYKRKMLELKVRMEAERIKGIKVGEINYVPAETVYAQVQDLDELAAWAEAEGHTDLLKAAANKEELNREVRRRLDDGEEMPPGVSFYVKEYISQRAA